MWCGKHGSMEEKHVGKHVGKKHVKKHFFPVTEKVIT